MQCATLINKTVRRPLNALRETQQCAIRQKETEVIKMENQKGNQGASSGSETVEPQRFQNQVHLYSVVQKNSCIFKFPAFLLHTNLGQPMHSPSAMTELPSPNLAGSFSLRAVKGIAQTRLREIAEQSRRREIRNFGNFINSCNC